MYTVTVDIQNSPIEVDSYDLGQYWNASSGFCMSREFVFEAVELVTQLSSKLLNVTSVAVVDGFETVNLVSRDAKRVSISYCDGDLSISVNEEDVFAGEPADLPYSFRNEAA